MNEKIQKKNTKKIQELPSKLKIILTKTGAFTLKSPWKSNSTENWYFMFVIAIFHEFYAVIKTCAMKKNIDLSQIIPLIDYKNKPASQ